MSTTSPKIDAGELKNYLYLFADNCLNKINTENFIDLALRGSLSKKNLAEHLKISRAKLYKKEAVITEEDVRTRLIPLVRISDLAYELYGKDKVKTQDWLMAPNHLFFNFSPFQMALGGKADVVLEKLKEWLDVA